MDEHKQPIDLGKVKFAIAVIFLGGLGSFFLQPLVDGNSLVVYLICVYFLALAGFLIIVLALIDGGKSLPPGSWRIAMLGSVPLINRLTRLKWLICIYLTTLLLIFLSLLLKDVWIERLYLFFTVIAFILTFKLPATLMQILQERIGQEISERQRAYGIPEESRYNYSEGNSS